MQNLPIIFLMGTLSFTFSSCGKEVLKQPVQAVDVIGTKSNGNTLDHVLINWINNSMPDKQLAKKMLEETPLSG